MSAFQLGLIQPAGLVGSYPSRTRDMNHREESVISKPFIMLLNSFCFLMVAKVTVGAMDTAVVGKLLQLWEGSFPVAAVACPIRAYEKKDEGMECG